jgi:hypothetical protein
MNLETARALSVPAHWDIMRHGAVDASVFPRIPGFFIASAIQSERRRPT